MTSTFSAQEKQTLLQLAHDAIAYGLNNHNVMPIDVENYATNLQATRACFVTLLINHELRGCIGSLEAHRPLVLDLVNNAYAAAFKDPRFPPLTGKELAQLEIHLSILSASKPLTFSSEQDLIAQLRPGVDGLILTELGYRGTFLPSVWEQLPDPALFLAHLKLKAGLDANYWSDTIKVERYTTESIP